MSDHGLQNPLAGNGELPHVPLVNELIESGDPRAKVVGKRRPAASASAAFDQLQEMVNRTWGGLPFPKGVHRFKSEGEFESWRNQLLTTNAPARRS